MSKQIEKWLNLYIRHCSPETNANKFMHSGSKKRRSFQVLLFYCR